MSDEQDVGLPEDIQKLLSEARDLDAPPAGADARIWAKLERSLGLPPDPDADSDGAPDDSAGDVGPSADGVSSESLGDAASHVASLGGDASQAAASLTISKAIALAWTAATFTVGAVAGAGTHAILTGPEPAPISSEVVTSLDMGAGETSSSREDMSASASTDMGAEAFADDMSLTDLAQPGDGGGEVDLSSSATAETSRKPEEKAVVSAKQRSALLRAERELLSRAERALGSNDMKAASAALEEHERRFGKKRAQLAEERDVLRIRVLIAQGNLASARARFKRFRATYPRSIFIDALTPALEQ